MTTILDMICVGDVVRLKSSNVPMTVNQVNKTARSSVFGFGKVS